MARIHDVENFSSKYIINKKYNKLITEDHMDKLYIQFYQTKNNKMKFRYKYYKSIVRKMRPSYSIIYSKWETTTIKDFENMEKFHYFQNDNMNKVYHNKNNFYKIIIFGGVLIIVGVIILVI